jgi:hypothetical protein
MYCSEGAGQHAVAQMTASASVLPRSAGLVVPRPTGLLPHVVQILDNHDRS